MNRRMNLFRQKRQPPLKKVAVVNARAVLKGKHGFHLGVGGGLFILVALGLLINYIGYKRAASNIDREVVSAKHEMEELVKQSEAITRSIARVEQMPQAASSSNAPKEPPGSRLDGTWTSLLWKVASATPSQVWVHRMILTGVGGSPGGTTPAAKQVQIEGQASTIGVVRDWIETLVHSVPGFDFVLEGESNGVDTTYPIQFKISARGL